MPHWPSLGRVAHYAEVQGYTMLSSDSISGQEVASGSGSRGKVEVSPIPRGATSKVLRAAFLGWRKCFLPGAAKVYGLMLYDIIIHPYG